MAYIMPIMVLGLEKVRGKKVRTQASAVVPLSMRKYAENLSSAAMVAGEMDPYVEAREAAQSANAARYRFSTKKAALPVPDDQPVAIPATPSNPRYRFDKKSLPLVESDSDTRKWFGLSGAMHHEERVGDDRAGLPSANDVDYSKPQTAKNQSRVNFAVHTIQRDIRNIFGDEPIE